MDLSRTCARETVQVNISHTLLTRFIRKAVPGWVTKYSSFVLFQKWNGIHGLKISITHRSDLEK